MRVTDQTRSILAYRREKRRMEAAGFHRIDAQYEVERMRFVGLDEVLESVQLASDGRSVWVRMSGDVPPSETVTAC